MRKIWLLAPITGVLVSFAAASDAPEPVASAELGLWQIAKQTNIPLFLAGGGRTPAETQAKSAEMLKRSGMKWEICITAESRSALLQHAMATGCSLPQPKLENGTATADVTCGSQSLHAIFVAGPDQRVRSVHTDIRDTSKPDAGGAVDVIYDTPRHITSTVTLNHRLNGVPMTDIWDFRQVSAECGNLKPGETRPAAQ